MKRKIITLLIIAALCSSCVPLNLPQRNDNQNKSDTMETIRYYRYLDEKKRQEKRTDDFFKDSNRDFQNTIKQNRRSNRR